MKKLALILSILCLSTSLSFGQGINFEQGKWADVVSKAKAANKLIFVDLYASWCGPCKHMAKNVFTDEEVGKKYNASFVSYKVDAEVGEGLSLAQKYGLKAYPTYLFIDPATQKEVYRGLGAMPPADFIKEADKALQKVKK